MAVIRAGVFQNFRATDEELLQAAAQILDMPQAQLELRYDGEARTVRKKKMEEKQDAGHIERN